MRLQSAARRGAIEVSTPRRSVVVEVARRTSRWTITAGGAVWELGALSYPQSFAKGCGRIRVSRCVVALRSGGFRARFWRRSGEVERVLATVVHLARSDSKGFDVEPTAPCRIWMTVIIPVDATYRPYVVYSEAIPEGADPEAFFGPAFWTSGYGVTDDPFRLPRLTALRQSLFSRDTWSLFRSILREPYYYPVMIPLACCLLGVMFFCLLCFVVWSGLDLFRRSWRWIGRLV